MKADILVKLIFQESLKMACLLGFLGILECLLLEEADIFTLLVTGFCVVFLQNLYPFTLV